MKTAILKFICFLLRLVLSLRYKVEVHGAKDLTKEKLFKKGGVLFLPNHPANIDPLLLYIHLWPSFQMRPLVIEYVYRQKFLGALMRMVRALPVPNFETSINELKIKRAEESLAQTVQGLENKEAFLIYPAGRLKRGAKEVLGGASAAHSLLERVPQTNVVLVRTTGLWGSSFSRALEQKSPDLQKTFWHGFKVLLKNGIFFCKRRKVLIEMYPNPAEFPQKASRLEFNRFLENWYNRYDDNGVIVDKEPLCLVSYSFYKELYLPIQERKKRQKGSINKNIDPEDKKKIIREIAHLTKEKEENIQDTMNLALDLGMDSLDTASLSGYLADHFDIGDIYPEDIETVKDVLELAAGQKYSARNEDEEQLQSWPEEPERPKIENLQGETLLEAYFHICKRMKNHAACADHISGVLTYKQMKRAVIALALEFRSIPKKHVGVLLPASCAAYIVIFALILANKVPVMLNWTLGEKFLNDTLKQTDSDHVISSWKFLERLSYVEFGEMIHKIRYLEDYRKNMSVVKKLRTAMIAAQSKNVILRKFGAQNITKNDIAVILFTSGTEAMPKGVPLTHHNLLINQKCAYDSLPIQDYDIGFGVLPTFHSFGLSVTGIFPILLGMRTAFYPDPTDSFALIKGIERWKATIFAGPPSFLRSVIHLAKKEQLATLKLLISGAEQPSATFLEQVDALKQQMYFIQGYGITECSPVVSMNIAQESRIGVGKPISCVECHTVHPETKKPLAFGEEGEICVTGPSVFGGYLDPKINPFIEFFGKKWYLTGDLGRVDKAGNIILSGRLKRFTKIGGEMVSLGAVEEGIRCQFPMSELPSFAVACIEKEGKAFLVLFTTKDLDLQSANNILRKAGFSRLVKINNIHKLHEIPITGTGKIDYRKLQSVCAAYE